VVLAICVAVTFGVSIYMMLGRELKGVAMGVFLIGHAANLSIIAMSRSPFAGHGDKAPPILTGKVDPADPLASIVDPLPQALILTAIVISFGVMGFLLSLLVVTARAAKTLEVDELGRRGLATPSVVHGDDDHHDTPEDGAHDSADHPTPASDPAPH
jgi:multicomponent Na+:H+ antiporter subunit C